MAEPVEIPLEERAAIGPWLIEWGGSITPLYWSRRMRSWTAARANASTYPSRDIAVQISAMLPPPPRGMVVTWKDWPALMERAALKSRTLTQGEEK